MKNSNRSKLNPSFQSIMEDLIAGPLSDLTNGYRTYPEANILEYNDNYVVELTIPGIAKDSIQISAENERLTISSSVQEQENEDNYRRREFNYQNFSRSFHLPETVDYSGINAQYDNGILKVSLPKKEEAKNKGTIKIAVK